MAAMMRTSTLRVRSAPTRSNSHSCSTRSSLACSSSGISPTSSRKSVPRSASSKRPARSLERAGERASHVAEELALEELFGDRGAVDLDQRLVGAAAARVDARARTAPCRRPIRPRMRTVAEVLATLSMSATTRSSAGLSPIRSPTRPSRISSRK